jgi:hypothetical protein
MERKTQFNRVERGKGNPVIYLPIRRDGCPSLGASLGGIEFFFSNIPTKPT